MSIGQKIKELRKLNKLTQNDLAKKSNISRSYLADIEKDRYNASLETLKAIAESLCVSISNILEENNSVEKEEKTIENDFPMIPEEFVNADDARAYVMKHQIFAYGGFYPQRMSDEDILNFANEMIEQAKLIRYKYESKNKNK